MDNIAHLVNEKKTVRLNLCVSCDNHIDELEIYSNEIGNV